MTTFTLKSTFDAATTKVPFEDTDSVETIRNTVADNLSVEADRIILFSRGKKLENPTAVTTLDPVNVIFFQVQQPREMNIVGFYNAGNSCYLNAMTQSLFSSRILRQFIRKRGDELVSVLGDASVLLRQYESASSETEAINVATTVERITDGTAGLTQTSFRQQGDAGECAYSFFAINVESQFDVPFKDFKDFKSVDKHPLLTYLLKIKISPRRFLTDEQRTACPKLEKLSEYNLRILCGISSDQALLGLSEVREYASPKDKQEISKVLKRRTPTDESKERRDQDAKVLATTMRQKILAPPDGLCLYVIEPLDYSIAMLQLTQRKFITDTINLPVLLDTERVLSLTFPSQVEEYKTFKRSSVVDKYDAVNPDLIEGNEYDVADMISAKLAIEIPVSFPGETIGNQDEVHIADLINSFLYAEALDEITICWKLPSVLIVSLSRKFKGGVQNLTKPVLTEGLTLREHATDSDVGYLLVGAHKYEPGHYYAYVRRDLNFYKANDSKITKLSSEKAFYEAAKTCTGYVFERIP